MIILGIDPGSRFLGFAVIDDTGRELKYIESGVLRYDKYDNFLDRLWPIFVSAKDLINKYRPDVISIESLIYVKSVTSLAKLAQARGAVLTAFLETHQGRIFEYSPNLVKMSVSGDGHADKVSIQKSLEFLFKKSNFSSYDESDALAIAVCHAMNNKFCKKITDNRVLLKQKKGGRTIKSVFKHLENVNR